MSNSEEKNNIERRQEFSLDEFFMKTFVKLQVTLASMEKDSDQKTDILHEIIDNITAISYNIKEIKDHGIKAEQLNIKTVDKLEKLTNQLAVIESRIESHDVSVQGDVKEIKYAIQNLSNSLLELKTEKKTKESEIEQNPSPKKLDIPELLSSVWDAIKNIKIILIVILAIFLIVMSVSKGIDNLSPLTNLLKTFIGG